MNDIIETINRNRYFLQVYTCKIFEYYFEI